MVLRGLAETLNLEPKSEILTKSKDTPRVRTKTMARCWGLWANSVVAATQRSPLPPQALHRANLPCNLCWSCPVFKLCSKACQYEPLYLPSYPLGAGGPRGPELASIPNYLFHPKHVLRHVHFVKEAIDVYLVVSVGYTQGGAFR